MAMPDALAHRVAELCTTYLRAPDGYSTDDVTGEPVLTFNPVLTTEEQATYTTILALARSGMIDMSPTDYTTIRTNLQTLRDLRQLGRNAFMALTAADRDRMIYDALVADTIIWLAVLRE